MKELLPVLLLAVLSLAFTACGDDNDEPVVPTTQKIESVYQNETEPHYVFDIDMGKDSSSIYLYNVKFSEQMPVTVNIRIDAPVTVDQSGEVFTYAGTNIVPYLIMGSTPVPRSDFMVTNLTCTVDTKNKAYDMFFNCHGGEYKNSGKLK